MRKRAPKYHEQKVTSERYGRELQGFGQHALVKQRGLRGTTLGPANNGRCLSKEERSAIEQKMRDNGKL